MDPAQMTDGVKGSVIGRGRFGKADAGAAGTEARALAGDKRRKPRETGRWPGTRARCGQRRGFKKSPDWPAVALAAGEKGG